MYQEIQFHPSYAVDTNEILGNNKTFFIAPESDHSSSLFEVAATLNSPLGWWFGWRFFPHMKDEALSPVGFMMEAFPIATFNSAQSAVVNKSTTRLIEIAKTHNECVSALLDWLKVEFDVSEPNTKLQNPIALESDAFVGEVKKGRGKQGLTSPQLKELRDEYVRVIEPARALADEARGLELRIHDLVNEAYGLTPEEVRLMWDTAPPRMPIKRPPGI